MTAGYRRHLLTLYSVTDGTDADGAPTETEAASGFAWAGVRPLSGRELFAAQAVEADVNVELTMDWVDVQTLHSKMRLGLGDRRFDIRAVLNQDERNRRVRVLASERP